MEDVDTEKHIFIKKSSEERPSTSSSRQSNPPLRSPSHSSSDGSSTHGHQISYRPERYNACKSSSRRRSRSPRSRSSSRHRRFKSRSPDPGSSRHKNKRTCLSISGLNPKTNEKRLEEIFGRYGPIKDVFIELDKTTNQCNGFAFVNFKFAEDASDARNNCHRIKVDDHTILLDFAIPDKASTPKRSSSSGSSCSSRYPATRYRRFRSRSHSPMSSRKRHIGLRDRPLHTNCLGIFGLNHKTNEETLRVLFEQYGAVKSVNVVFDKKTQRSRGFAFLAFQSVEDASVARDACNGMEVDGHKIRVDFSITERAHTPTPGIYVGLLRDGSRRSVYWDKKKLKRKNRRSSRDRDDGSHRYNSSSYKSSRRSRDSRSYRSRSRSRTSTRYR